MKPVCWWCCHAFEAESLHFPYAFTANVFYTTGHFCTWACMKAYAIDKNRLGECEYITLMRKRMEGKITSTKKAPSRYMLDTFGGTLTIEEFRQVSPNTIIKIPGEIFQQQTIYKEDKPTEGLKLKREKPLERSKCKLETSLGVTRKCHAAASETKEKRTIHQLCGNSQTVQV